MTQLAVAVSGGVDSLCALLRLREQGHDVLALHGLFLPDAASSGLRPAPEGPRLLTAAEALATPLPPASRQAVEGLQTACGQLGIPLHVADMRAVFDREVVTPFVRAYARGRTPNPCALCNRAIKFGALLDAALSLGADRIATGHYARLLDGPAGPVLAAADDLAKDQSYFLSLVPLERLRRAVFPLARQDKAASIAQVKDAGLAVPVPQESQEICFIPAGEDAYRAFLERRWQAEGLSLPGSGPVLLEEADSDGRPVLRPLARHEGLWRYTEGQRRGLGIAHSEPLYVLRKQGEDNTLVVGGRARLGMRGCLTGPANLLCPPEQWPDTLLARLRHRQRKEIIRRRFRNLFHIIKKFLFHTLVFQRFDLPVPFERIIPDQALRITEPYRDAGKLCRTIIPEITHIGKVRLQIERTSGQVQILTDT